MKITFLGTGAADWPLKKREGMTADFDFTEINGLPKIKYNTKGEINDEMEQGKGLGLV